jgi:hypothetical protein
VSAAYNPKQVRATWGPLVLLQPGDDVIKISVPDPPARATSERLRRMCSWCRAWPRGWHDPERCHRCGQVEGQETQATLAPGQLELDHTKRVSWWYRAVFDLRAAFGAGVGATGPGPGDSRSRTWTDEG